MRTIPGAAMRGQNEQARFTPARHSDLLPLRFGRHELAGNNVGHRCKR